MTGIIYLSGRRVALSVMTTFVPDASNAVGQAAPAVYHHYRKLASSNAYGSRTAPLP